MSVIQILSVKASKTGKSLIVKAASGKDYFAKIGSGLEDGMNIEAETKASEKDGKEYVWIEKWKRVATVPAPLQQATKTVAVQEQFTADGINMAFLPFTSNAVAHAIQAGKIDQPGDIKKWAQAAYSAALSLKDVPY